MTIGCVICSESFSSADPSEKHPVAIRNCGHAFHSGCLSSWLAKSKTCPVCRSTTLDSPSYINRLHLQAVNNLNVSGFYSNSTSSSGSKTEIEELRQKLADSNEVIEKLKDFITEAQKNLTSAREMIMSLPLKIKEGAIIDLSSSPRSSTANVVVERAPRIAARNPSGRLAMPTRSVATRQTVFRGSGVRFRTAQSRSSSTSNLSVYGTATSAK